MAESRESQGRKTVYHSLAHLLKDKNSVRNLFSFHHRALMGPPYSLAEEQKKGK